MEMEQREIRRLYAVSFHWVPLLSCSFLFHIHVCLVESLLRIFWQLSLTPQDLWFFEFLTAVSTKMAVFWVVTRLWHYLSSFVGSLALIWSWPTSPWVQPRLYLDLLVPFSLTDSSCAAYIWLCMDLWNVGKFIQVYMTLQLRRQLSSYNRIFSSSTTSLVTP